MSRSEREGHGEQWHPSAKRHQELAHTRCWFNSLCRYESFAGRGFARAGRGARRDGRSRAARERPNQSRLGVRAGPTVLASDRGVREVSGGATWPQGARVALLSVRQSRSRSKSRVRNAFSGVAFDLDQLRVLFNFDTASQRGCIMVVVVCRSSPQGSYHAQGKQEEDVDNCNMAQKAVTHSTAKSCAVRR